MNPLNSILLEGNVVKTPDLRETAKGTSVCSFSIASNRSYRSEAGTFDKEVSFFEVETWGQLAVICSQHCVKGRGVRVVGRLKQGRWTDQAGKNHSKITIIAEHVELKPIFQRDDNTDDESTESTGSQKSSVFIDEKATQDEIVAERDAALVF